MSRSVFIALSIACLAIGSAVRAQSVDRLLEQAANAVGNKSDLDKLRSISAIADCEGPNGKYTTTLVSFKGHKTIFEQTFAYKPERSKLRVSGDLIWNVESGEPVITTAFQRMIVRGHEYQKMAFDLRSFFAEFTLAGEENFEGRSSTKVLAKNELGMPVSLYFDKQTKRFAGYVIHLPNSTDTVKNVFLEWKKVGKVMLPSVVKATDSQGDWTLRFHTIRLNVGNERLADVPPRIADIAEILKMHEQQKTAHLTYDAEMLVGLSADDSLEVSRGNVASPSRAEALARFKRYFSSFRFIEWEDITPPTIKISKDGTLATKIVQKRVRGTYKNEKGEDVSTHTVFAWLEVLEKIDGKWKMTAIASTDKTVDQ